MADLDAVEARIWAHFTAVKRSAHSFRSLADDLAQELEAFLARLYSPTGSTTLAAPRP